MARASDLHKKWMKKKYRRAYESLEEEFALGGTVSSGSVFADLGLKDSDELFTRAKLGFCVDKILQGKKLKQREIARVLGIADRAVSHLMNGHYSRFTTEKLLAFLKKLNRGRIGSSFDDFLKEEGIYEGVKTRAIKQEWLGHAEVSTTRLYDRRETLPREMSNVQDGVLRKADKAFL
jgi:predicted XRE-type DNA-binding protein